MTTPSPVQKGPMFALGVFFVAVLGLIVSLGYFAFPLSDDYGFAVAIAENGMRGHLLNMFYNASGRFVSNLLYVVSPMFVGNLTLYHALALIQVILLVLAIRCLIAACHRGGAGSAWLITLCLCAAFVAGLPSLRQTIYWLATSIVYFVPFLALFGLAALMAKAAFSPAALKKRHVVLLFGLLVLTMGGNEITASACLFFLLLAWGCARFTLHPKTRLFGYLFLAATVLLCFSFLTPGNFARIGTITQETGRTWQWEFLIRVLGGAFEGYKWFLIKPILPAVALICFFFKPRWTPSDFGLSLRKRLLIVFVLGCTLFFGEYLLAYVSGKRAPATRIQCAMYDSAFVFALAAAAFLMKDILRLRDRLIHRFGTRALLAASAAVILAIGLQPSVVNGVRNLANGDLAAYREAWHHRLALIPPKPLGKNLVLTLPVIELEPAPVAFGDVLVPSPKEGFGVLIAFARYYGLKGVLVEPAPSQRGKSTDGTEE